MGQRIVISEFMDAPAVERLRQAFEVDYRPTLVDDAAALAAALPRADEAGTWPRQMLSQGREAAGKVMGLVGFGSIGRLTARKAAALGMTVRAYDPVVRADDSAWREHGVAQRDLDTLLAESDVVS